MDWPDVADNSIRDILDYINSYPDGYPKSEGIDYFKQITFKDDEDDDQIMGVWCGNEGGGTTVQQVACAIIIIIIIVAFL